MKNRKEILKSIDVLLYNGLISQEEADRVISDYLMKLQGQLL